MKKNVVKAMSVGLSAITIASSLSVPVLADELDSNATDPQATTEDAGEITPVAEQKESKTPVTDEIKRIAEDIKPAQPEVTPDTSETPDVEDFSSDSMESVDPEDPAAEPAEGNPVAPTLSEVDQHIQNASDSLNELADGVEAKENEEQIEENKDEADDEKAPADTEKKDENAKVKEALGTVDVEKANKDAKDAIATADASEATASQSAKEAYIIAEQAASTALQADIDATRAAIAIAQANYSQAETDASIASEAVETAKQNLDDVLRENGFIFTVNDDETGETIEKSLDDDFFNNLVDLLENLKGEAITDEDLGSLSGPAREAIKEAFDALVQARNDEIAANTEKASADEAVRLIKDSLVYQIAVAQDELEKAIANNDESAKGLATSKIAGLAYEYYLKENVAGYVANSATFSAYMKTDQNNNDVYESYYFIQDEYGTKSPLQRKLVVYKVDISDEGKFLGISYADVEEATGVTEGKAAIPEKWTTADGSKEFKDGEAIKTVKLEEGEGFYAIDTAGEKVEVGDEYNDENATTAGKHYKHISEVVGYETKSEIIGDRQDYAVTYYMYGNDASVQFYKAVFTAGSVLGWLDYWGLDNCKVEVKVYNENNELAQSILVDDIMGSYGYDWTSIKASRFEVEVSYPDYDKPITKDYVLETVVEEVPKTEPTSTYITTISARNEEWAKWQLRKDGYDLERITLKNVGWGQYQVYQKGEKTTNVLEVTSRNLYEAEKYTVKIDEVPAEPGVPYANYTSGEFITSVDSVKTANAISSYEEATTEAGNAATNVTNKQVKTGDTETKLKKVINAVKQVLSLEAVENDKNNTLDAIKGVIQSATNNLNIAIQKKAANDAAAAAAASTGGATTTTGGATTTTGGGAPVVYPSATVAAATEEVDETVIPDDAVPAAGQTRTTRTRRTAANNVVVAGEDTTTIDEAETPLAGGTADEVVEDTQDEVTTVEEDVVPLAGEAQKGFLARTWWGWLLLIIAVVTGGTAYAKKKAKVTKSSK